MAGDPRFAEHEGMVAQNARDWPRAVRAFRRATAHEPYNGILWYRLRAALRQVGDAAELDRVNRWYTSFEEAFKRMRPASTTRRWRSPRSAWPRTPSCITGWPTCASGWAGPTRRRAWHRLVLRDDPADAISLAALDGSSNIGPIVARCARGRAGNRRVPDRNTSAREFEPSRP